jgi:proliferating cell nuclear antigen
MSCRIAGGDRVAEYDMKLMDIDADTLGIPDTDYDARITMLSSEFTRIVRDLLSLGESVRIEVSKEGVRFASDGEAAQGNILLKQTDAARERYENYGKDDEDQEEDVKEEDVKEEDDEDKPKKAKKAKKVKKEEGVEDEDAEMASGNDDEAEFQVKSEDEGEEEVSDSENKKRKRPAASSSVRFLTLTFRAACHRHTEPKDKKEGEEGGR